MMTVEKVNLVMKLNSGSSTIDTVTVNKINDMTVELFENKTVSEVEA